MTINEKVGARRKLRKECRTSRRSASHMRELSVADSNSTFDRGSLSPTYIKPFDVFATAWFRQSSPMPRSSRHADEFGQGRRRVFSTPRNGRLQRIGRGAKRPTDHAILIGLAGGCRNQRNARARCHHPEDHLQMIQARPDDHGHARVDVLEIGPKCRFVNARPEPDFRYFSKRTASRSVAQFHRHYDGPGPVGEGVARRTVVVPVQAAGTSFVIPT